MVHFENTKQSRCTALALGEMHWTSLTPLHSTENGMMPKLLHDTWLELSVTVSCLARVLHTYLLVIGAQWTANCAHQT